MKKKITTIINKHNTT